MENFGKTAGLGKYCMGGYGRIGVYRVKDRHQWSAVILEKGRYLLV